MACVEEPRRLIASLSKWLRFHRRRSCGSMRGSLLSGCTGTAGGRRCRVLLLPVLVACLLVVLLGVPRSGLQSSSGSSGITAPSIPKNASGMGSGCNSETGSMCGFGLLPDVLCPETRESQMLSRFTDFRTSPWSKGVTALRKANSKTIRLLQYSLWSPAVVRNVNSRVEGVTEGQDWEETRVQVLASALLSQSDIVCLQGLEYEQAVWLKQALNSQGFSGVISTELAPGGHVPKAATFWRRASFTLFSSDVTIDHHDSSSNIAQGALVLLLKAFLTIGAEKTAYILRIANTVVDSLASSNDQVAVLSAVLSQMTSRNASESRGRGHSVEGEATILCGQLTFPPGSLPSQYLKGGTLPSQVNVESQFADHIRQPAWGGHKWDLDSVYAVVSRREHLEFDLGMQHGSVWYVPGVVQALNALVPGNISTLAHPVAKVAKEWGRCVPSLVDFAVESDKVIGFGRGTRVHSAANPLSKLEVPSRGGGFRSEDMRQLRSENRIHRTNRSHLLRDLISIQAVCINLDEVLMASKDLRVPSQGVQHDGLVYMFNCAVNSRSSNFTEHEGLQLNILQASAAMTGAATTAQRLQVLTDLLVKGRFTRQAVRACAKSWPMTSLAASAKASTTELITLLRQHRKRIYLKSDGLFELARRLGSVLGIPDVHLVANSLSYGPDHRVLGVTRPGDKAANSVDALFAQVRLHRHANKAPMFYLIIGGSDVDQAARTATSNHSVVNGVDLLISLNHSGIRDAPPASDWHANQISEVALAYRLAYQLQANAGVHKQGPSGGARRT